MTLLEAAQKLRPGTTWNLRGNVLEQAQDSAPRVSIPTRDELVALVDSADYIDKRSAEYPPIGDQLDAIWKLLKDPKDLDGILVQKAIDDVKAKYPKT